MKRMRISAITTAAVVLAACASDVSQDPLADFEEVDNSTILEAPAAQAGNFAPADRDAIDRGKYLIELLGCGACHTSGALDGAPDMSLALAGSQTGIAWTNPLNSRYPGVVYPPNITPDEETGIGLWSDDQIANAIRAGIGRHGSRRIASMPWQGYSKLHDDDVDAMVAYLRSIEPVRHKVPRTVEPGQRASKPYVYFGVFRDPQ